MAQSGQTDFEVLVVLTKENPKILGLLALLVVMLLSYCVMEVLTFFDVPKIVRNVVGCVRRVASFLCTTVSAVCAALAVGFFVVIWPFVTAGNMICTGVDTICEGFAFLKSLVCGILHVIFIWPLAKAKEIVMEVWALLKIAGYYGVLIVMHVCLAPVLVARWTVCLSARILRDTVLVVWNEFRSQLHRFNQFVDNGMKDFKEDGWKEIRHEFRDPCYRCKNLYNIFVFGVVAVLWWWTLVVLHTTVLYATSFDCAKYITGREWTSDITFTTTVIYLVNMIKHKILKECVIHLRPAIKHLFGDIFTHMFDKFPVMFAWPAWADVPSLGQLVHKH